MGHIIGIDLGTTYSSIAVVHEGSAKVITTSQGRRIPSLVAFSANGDVLIGQAAVERATFHHDSRVFSIKQLLEQNSTDDKGQLVCHRSAKRRLVASHGDDHLEPPYVSTSCSATDIVAAFLSRLKQEAEHSLGAPVEQTVVAVPAYFTEQQRDAVRRACRVAGLRTVRLVPEPVAAAIAYGLGRGKVGTALVVDLGGGTYDVSILRLDEDTISVLATDSDRELGGNVWDAAIVEWIADKFLRQHGVDLRKNIRAVRRLREAAERARIALSATPNTVIELPFVHTDSRGPKHLRLALSREQLEALTAGLEARLAPPVERTLDDAGLSWDDLGSVLLVGGASQMPALRAKLRELSGRDPLAAVPADEAVALGAATAAGTIADEVDDTAINRATPLTLGLETMGGLMTPLIARNTPVPAQRTAIFSTVEDGQSTVTIHVLQGERQLARDNETVGVFNLEGIPEAPRGVPQIEVTFSVDADGRLHVSARETAVGNSKTLKIHGNHTPGNHDVQRHVAEARRSADADQERLRLVAARTAAQQTIYQAGRTIRHLNGHKTHSACAALQQRLERQINALRRALERENVAKIYQLTEEIQQAGFMLERIAYGPFDVDGED